MQKIVVLSVGGSLINPGQIQTGFLGNLKMFIETSPHKFIIVCGGGANARVYGAVAKEFGVVGESLDFIGIKATLLNAELLRHILGAGPVQQKPSSKEFNKVLVAGGWLPGCSTDYDAVLWAKKYKTGQVINLSNTDYVYTKDPSLAGAEPLPSLKWDDYLKLITTKWSAGLKTPFDPVASREAKKSRVQVICINGASLGNLDKFLSGKEFVGTVIS